MLEPKERFQRVSFDVAKWQAEIALSPNYQHAAEVALLQLITELPDTVDPVVAAAFWQRVSGAKAFYNQLMLVGTKTTIPARPVTSSQLNHQA